MRDMQLRIVTSYAEPFSFLKCQDPRRVAAAVIVKKILLLRISRFGVRSRLDKDDNVLEPASSFDQIGFIGQSLTAVVLIFGDLNGRKFRKAINKLNLTGNRAGTDRIHDTKEDTEESSQEQ